MSQSVNNQQPGQPAAQQPAPAEDIPVLQSEVNDMKQAVVSMSVGQPDRTTTIVKEWLEQPAPAAPASEPADAPAESGGGDDAATDESGKG